LTDLQPSIVLLHGVQSSRLTWWRIEQDLHDLGWETQALDLLGHGERAGVGPDRLDLDVLADDVLARIDRPIDVLAGHSIGAIVALLIAQREEVPMRAVLVEDPPASASAACSSHVAADLASAARSAITDPYEARTHLLEDNPLWAQPDADNAVISRQRVDVERVGAMLRDDRWDLPALVSGATVPVRILVAEHGSALDVTARSAMTGPLPPIGSSPLASGHSIHRDRPALWLHHLMGLAAAIEV
jgi:pimeloyl-ACP methyl ester carboxylesterase